MEPIVGDTSGAVDNVTQDFNALFLTKKKKPKTKPSGVGHAAVAEPGVANKENEVVSADGVAIPSPAYYTYEELLKRVFAIMREKNPNIVAGEHKRFVMRPPQVAKVGTKKTSFMNFAEICKFGSLDANKALIIKGKFQQKHIENVLVNYIKEYVTCHTCKSPNTFLQKEDRLFFLQCESCGARCSVASIKTGFQAQVSKKGNARPTR